MTVYGYARVSAKDQNLARQLDALSHFGVDEIVTDKASGKDFDRPGYASLTGRMRPGDVLAVMSIDRLGRDYDGIISEWRRVTKDMGCAIVVLDMPLLDTREEKGGVTATLISDIVLQLLSYVAQVERENTRRRQAEGIAAAKARGVRFGRPPKKRPANFGDVVRRFERGELTRSEAASELGCGTTAFDRWRRSA